MVTRLAVRMIENPAMSGGIIVMALTAVAVVSNALFLQQAHHPEPWFATRPGNAAIAPGSGEIAVPDPRPRAAHAVEPPLPRVQPADAQPEPGASAPAVAPTLIADLQRALGARGFYSGKVDGISGSRTRAAIVAYEQSQGLETTGLPSVRLLEHITLSPSAAPVATAAPDAPDVSIAELAATPAQPAEIPSVPAVEPVASEAPAGEPQAAPTEMLSYPPRAGTAEPVVATKASTSQTAPETGLQRTLSVQKALNLIGYGPVPEDGVANEATIAAIRRFELDNGLPITGAAGDILINRLVAIGAMEAA